MRLKILVAIFAILGTSLYSYSYYQSHRPAPIVQSTPAAIQPNFLDKNFTDEFVLNVPEDWRRNDSQYPTQYFNYEEKVENPPVYVESRDKGKLKIEISGIKDITYDQAVQKEVTPFYPDETFDTQLLTVDGQSATLITSNMSDTSAVVIQNPVNKHIYRIYFYFFKDNLDLRDQILSSFRFAE